MTDAGLFMIAVALYFGLKAIADALRSGRKIDVTIPGTWNVVHQQGAAPASHSGGDRDG